MLTEKQISQIKEHLDRAQNPVFFFDNDPDGLCSFLLLQRYIGRGKGVAIKSFPGLAVNYFRKVHELNADYVFILDKPVVDDDFFKELEKINMPTVWIDHHEVQVEIPKFVSYYNPLFNKTPTNEPVTALCYQISQRKEDAWIALFGSISDMFIPEFYNDFVKEYPELAIASKDIFEIRYKSRVGEMINIVSNGLKDTISNVVLMLKFLTKAKGPYDVLEETPKNRRLHYRSSQIGAKYKVILNKAKKLGRNPGKLLFFRYSGDLSVSGELSNEIYYYFPKKIIVVAYMKGDKTNLSLRGENVRDLLLEAIKGIDGANGGGHKNAVGGQINTKDLSKFEENLKSILDNSKI
ncbi:MAG: hypothetical protein KKB31_02745 [Nanoarchaeota archaeon]|nr:hypothetical protein [Nanoarchaeota archaeon]